jgi:hypothetical protein
LEGIMAARAQEIRAGLAWLRAADPVLAQPAAGRCEIELTRTGG